MTGYIDSVEPMGLVDGPGIRFVVFLKGCKLRCLFCHNPETWVNDKQNEITSDELINQILKYKNYYINGGVTFSGGEPLLQPDFLIDVLKKCKENNLHTAIDTSGVGLGDYEEILKYTDLVILDIKAINDIDYEKMTGYKMNEFNHFVDILNKSNKKVWIRQVIVPTINDSKEYILKLNEYIKKINNVEKVELLPYHLYGVEKYKKLNIPYKLDNIPSLSNEKLQELEMHLEKKA